MAEIDLDFDEERINSRKSTHNGEKSKLMFKNKRDDYRMSKDDVKILERVSGLSILVIIVVIFIITISVLIRFTDIVKYFMVGK